MSFTFGATNQPQQQQQGFGLAGATNLTANKPVGFGTSTSQPTGNLFGNTATINLVANTPGTSLFGNTASTLNAGFGQQQQPVNTGFGTATNTFGNTTNAFGNLGEYLSFLVIISNIIVFKLNYFYHTHTH